MRTSSLLLETGFSLHITNCSGCFDSEPSIFFFCRVAFSTLENRWRLLKVSFSPPSLLHPSLAQRSPRQRILYDLGHVKRPYIIPENIGFTQMRPPPQKSLSLSTLGDGKA